MGPQNTIDLGQQFEDVHDRLDALERIQRLHATSITHADQAISENRAAINTLDTDISAYKIFITKTHKVIDEYVASKNLELHDSIRTLSVQFESFMGAIPPNVDLLLQRVKEHQDQLEQLAGMLRSGVRPNYAPNPPGLNPWACEIHTPPDPQPQEPQPQPQEQPAPQPPAYETEDPWYRASQNPTRTQTAPAAAEPATARVPLLAANQPQRPQSFVALQTENDGPQSPFTDGADPFHTPNGRAPGMQSGAHPGVSAYAGGKLCIFEPSRKENKNLFTFTQDAKDYQIWRNRMVDHFCRSTQKWRQILEYVQTGNSPIRKSWLLDNNIEGVNAWDLSTMVESFLVDYFPRSMYNHRVQLSGGEMGNGFEMWRRLFIDFQGGSTAVEFGGVRRLQEFPKCTSLSKLSEHLDDWTDVLATYGSELEHCPRLLRNMVLSIIPKNLEDEILDQGDDPKFRTYVDIIQWCKRKVITLRTKELSELSRKPPGASRVNALRQHDDEPNARTTDDTPPPLSWEGMKKEIVAVLRESIGQTNHQAPVSPPPQVHAVTREQRKGDKGKGRGKSPSTKFFFKGCWHCGKEEPKHNRQNCPLFEAILKRANPGVSDRKLMKLPDGYKGAYEKAREAAGLTNKKKRLNMLDDEDVDDSDSDFENESPLPGRLCALRTSQIEVPPPQPHPEARQPRSYRDVLAGPATDKSRFQALAQEDVGSLDQHDVDSLNGWSVKVSRKASRQSKPIEVPRMKSESETFTIQSERALDELLSRYPHIAAIPGSHKKIRKILRSMPDELVCADDEVVYLVDSGSTINAAWIEKHFPSYAHLIQKTPASLRGDTATTAGGQKLVNKGRCSVHGMVDGHEFPIAFKDMETELPILSVRKMVKRNNEVKFKKSGGFIRNRDTGRVLKFHEHESIFLEIEGPRSIIAKHIGQWK